MRDLDALSEAVVDLWFDPVCPYSWTAQRWLAEVAACTPIVVHHHVMSLYFVNERRTDVDPGYRRNVELTRGPSRAAIAVVQRFGEAALGGFYDAFGQRNFAGQRFPTPAEQHHSVRAALAEMGLPADLEDAMDTDAHDTALRLSHDTGFTLVGGDVGTPITRVDGRAFFGPILNAIPRGAQALDVFEGMRRLAAFPEFFELKRTRLSPPVFT
ncbi:hypothetical protein [Knoellia subterranea]|uniref:DSBA oxidoreductase n=1 Tax=Knoellia subterranea KCTC 19937 TaxID=1385521 RepID=A0A0A0JPC3_9MICO|nr:hypothetical protein [Knoellia subterranea]KGN37451.1 DSBA oxidoreductase [Knoellia subterranea KCTC 19937]